MIKLLSILLLTAMAITAMFSGAPWFLLPLPIFAGLIVVAMAWSSDGPSE